RDDLRLRGAEHAGGRRRRRAERGGVVPARVRVRPGPGLSLREAGAAVPVGRLPAVTRVSASGWVARAPGGASVAGPERTPCAGRAPAGGGTSRGEAGRRATGRD